MSIETLSIIVYCGLIFACVVMQASYAALTAAMAHGILISLVTWLPEI